MAASLSNVIESLDLVALTELVAQGYELQPEEKPSILQRFEEEIFKAEIESNIDSMVFNEDFYQKLAILSDLYQQDPEVLQQLNLLKPKKFSLNVDFDILSHSYQQHSDIIERSSLLSPKSLDLDLLMSEEALIKEAIALSLAETPLLETQHDEAPVSNTSAPHSTGSPRRYAFIEQIGAMNSTAISRNTDAAVNTDEDGLAKNSPRRPK